jgi:hypothetical protein
MKDVKADMQGKDENALTATKKRMAKKRDMRRSGMQRTRG